MKRKILGVLSVVLCFCTLCSCDNLGGGAKTSDAASGKPIVAVATDSDESLAAEAYSAKIGGDLVRYNLSSDAVVAVLNGKADYVVLDEYESQEYIDAGNKLEFVESTEHKIEYVAWFNTEDKELKNEFNRALSELGQEGVLTQIKESNIKGVIYTYQKKIPPKGELVMLCDPLFENILYYSESGEVCGTDFDIAKAVCTHLGYELRIKIVDFDKMFACLEDGEGDFIMSASEYTAERAEYFIASDVYSSLNYNVYKRD
ncbi:MAG: transporter substrate-binding domain-containing protein [Clostridia bacterium]|nr:transporter substrate-binding domain-containing protein [Clostridia bacterium]